MEKISAKTGIPPKGYTDVQWQKDFIKIRETIQPSSLNRMRVVYEPTNFKGTYHGKTQNQYYCETINDILSNIRKGESDYCFYIYQIAELLRYEHDRLKAVWKEEERCFKLSINK